MHGLNTKQIFDFINPTNLPSAAASPQAARTYIINPTFYGEMQTLLGTTFTGDIQFWLKRYYWQMTFTNVNHIPVMMEIYKFRMRRDLSSNETVSGILNASVNTNQGGSYAPLELPGISPFTGDDARKTFKILSKRRKVLQPMRQARVFVSMQRSWLRKAISADVEGSAQYNARKGSTLALVRFYGVPVNYEDTAAGSVQGTALGPIFVRGTYLRYASYYRMDDVTPTSDVTIPFTIPLPANNVAFHPAYTNTVTLQDMIGTPSPLYPASREFVASLTA